jgi:hypothetical protein
MKPGKHLIKANGKHSDACYPCKLAGIQFAPSAMPTRSPEAARVKVADKKLDKDRDAYQRIRRNGEQPRAVQGSSELERTATESFEIKTGVTMRDSQQRRHARSLFADMPPPSSKPGVIGRDR